MPGGGQARPGSARNRASSNCGLRWKWLLYNPVTRAQRRPSSGGSAFVSNLSGVVLQYFYMGRKMDWRDLIQFGAPSQPKGGKGLPRTTAPQPAIVEIEAIEASESGEATMPSPQSARRNKNGRRRGKR